MRKFRRILLEWVILIYERLRYIVDNSELSRKVNVIHESERIKQGKKGVGAGG